MFRHADATPYEQGLRQGRPWAGARLPSPFAAWIGEGEVRRALAEARLSLAADTPLATCCALSGGNSRRALANELLDG